MSRCPSSFYQQTAKITLLILLVPIFLTLCLSADEITTNPGAYVLDKFQSHDIVFLGTRHKQPPILKFISDLIPTIHSAGVTYIYLEIDSDFEPTETLHKG